MTNWIRCAKVPDPVRALDFRDSSRQTSYTRLGKLDLLRVDCLTTTARAKGRSPLLCHNIRKVRSENPDEPHLASSNHIYGLNTNVGADSIRLFFRQEHMSVMLALCAVVVTSDTCPSECCDNPCTGTLGLSATTNIRPSTFAHRPIGRGQHTVSFSRAHRAQA